MSLIDDSVGVAMTCGWSSTSRTCCSPLINYFLHHLAVTTASSRQKINSTKTQTPSWQNEHTRNDLKTWEGQKQKNQQHATSTHNAANRQFPSRNVPIICHLQFYLSAALNLHADMTERYLDDRLDPATIIFITRQLFKDTYKFHSHTRSHFCFNV